MLRVDTLQDLFMAAETLARFGGNRDDALTIMTNGGGAGVMAADAAALAGVAAAPSSARRRCARLDAVLPPTWSHANPIDIIGDAPVERYVETLQALLADPATARCSSCTRRPRSCAATTSRAPACRWSARRPAA